MALIRIWLIRPFFCLLKFLGLLKISFSSILIQPLNDSYHDYSHWIMLQLEWTQLVLMRASWYAALIYLLKTCKLQPLRKEFNYRKLKTHFPPSCVNGLIRLMSFARLLIALKLFNTLITMLYAQCALHTKWYLRIAPFFEFYSTINLFLLGQVCNESFKLLVGYLKRKVISSRFIRFVRFAKFNIFSIFESELILFIWQFAYKGKHNLSRLLDSSNLLMP